MFPNFDHRWRAGVMSIEPNRVSTGRVAQGAEFDELCSLHRAEGLYGWVRCRVYMRNSLDKT